ncbi:SDR family NAD(P)-dependent oxidoreductase [Aestuariivirga sp.]|uniref:SDR family NAD(P)-dependent oxidoreductase n=1 Tax=Aestuariivirga sp. TaxID=2650926 RepID=UPI00391CE320
MPKRQLALVTGASTGIGYELAELCAADGFDLVIAADEPEIESAAQRLEGHGVKVDWVECDLATEEGVEEVLDAVGRRQVDVLMANAGHGLGEAFLDQDFEDILHVVDTNITGTLFLIHRVGQRMRKRGSGRILITGSIAGFIPGAYQAVYNASKAFLDSFSFALRAELAESGVTVTCLMPGATETEFFDRAGLTDTKIGQQKKDDPKDVARSGFDAMMRGDGDVVTGWQNKLQTAIASVTPAGLLARQHAKKAAPGTGESS